MSFSETPPPVVESARYSFGGGDNYSLFAPLHYEPGYAYPLVIWLHGPLDNEHQLKKIMPLVSMRNYAAVGPRGTLPMQTESGLRAYGWAQTHDQILHAEHAVFDAYDAATTRFNIAPHRIFLAGYDCGGTMALRIALQYPGKFAGVLSLGGAFPEGSNPLAKIGQARRLPVFLACGRQAEKFPSQQVCDNLRLLHSAGMSVTLRQYPCGDELTTQMLSDMDRWIMEQVLPSEAPALGQAEHSGETS